MDEKAKIWVAVKSLGDRAILLGYNRAICLSTATDPGFRANCIYYTDDYLQGCFEKSDGCYDMGIFSLEDGRIKQLFLDHLASGLLQLSHRFVASGIE